MGDSVDVYVTTERPSLGPHEHDTINGLVYRLLFIEEGRPSWAPWLAKRVETAIHNHRRLVQTEVEWRARWSWGNAAIVADSAREAERLARDTVDGLEGLTFCGFIK